MTYASYGILPVSFSFVGLVNKADCRSESALRFLNLKRFPRTRAQVGEGWKRPRCKLHRLVTTTPVPRALTPPRTRLYCRTCVHVWVRMSVPDQLLCRLSNAEAQHFPSSARRTLRMASELDTCNILPRCNIFAAFCLFNVA